MACDDEIVNRNMTPQSGEKEAVASSSDESSNEVVAEPPPDGGYGWICVAAVFIINGFTWGVNAVRLLSSR